MQKRHYKDLGSKLGFPVGYAVYQEDHDGTGCTFGSDSEYLRIIQLAQLKNITIEQQYDLKEHVQDLSFSNLRIISNELKRYKKEYSLIDYNDMILDFTKSDKSPKFDVVFIDEAQDLSLMQWEMARSIWKKTEDSFIAGDDDQAIYKWAGADVDSFIALKGQYLPLTQSYRIPAKVHGLAMGIINRIRNRIDKTWQPKVNEGTLQRHFDVDSIDMTKGDWLVLSRTRHMLTDIGESLYRQGLYYKNKYKRTNEQVLHEAATAWEYLRQGQLITYKQVESISKYMGPKHWHAKKIKGMAKESFYGIDQLVKDYGLQVKTVWYEAFDEAGQTEVDYLRKMRKNGEKLNEKPRIELSTIHGAKGGEATNVVLLTNLTENTMRSYERNPDDENRLFYVGATRTKENLHIIEPKKYEKGYLL
jgi:DNA helicase II / ATP-dependent DNA helicase PcrA